MSEVIPEDVMKTARAVALEVRDAACYDGTSDCPGIDWDNDNAAYDIARAILAERERWTDKVDGLEADLDSAVEVAWKRGATDWVRMNYPAHYERLTTGENERAG